MRGHERSLARVRVRFRLSTLRRPRRHTQFSLPSRAADSGRIWQHRFLLAANYAARNLIHKLMPGYINRHSI